MNDDRSETEVLTSAPAAFTRQSKVPSPSLRAATVAVVPLTVAECSSLAQPLPLLQISRV